MAETITVSTATLREQARRIRGLVQAQLEQHRLLSTQISTTAGRLPADLRDAHASANSGWHNVVEAQYANYVQLAMNMELAADWYDWLDQHVVPAR